MEVKLIEIGNSKGFRIPKSILKQINCMDKANLEVKDNKFSIHTN